MKIMTIKRKEQKNEDIAWYFSFVRRITSKKNDIYSTNIFLYHLINNDETLFITGLILQETLSSITNVKLYNQIKEILLKFAYIEPD